MNRESSPVVLVILSFLLGCVASLPALAGSAVVGAVAANVNATLNGAPILPDTTIISGESLEVKEGVAIVSTGHGGLLTFGRQTTVSFVQEEAGVAVQLSEGTVTVRHPATSRELVIKAGEVAIVPGEGMRTEGEIASLGGTVVVSTQEGVLRVKANGQEVEVGKGKKVTMSTQKAQAAPSPQGGGAPLGGAALSTGLTVASITASAVTAVLSALEISHLDSATSAANSAASNANQAASSASSAASAASAAAAQSNAVGCAIESVLGKRHPHTPSPYIPPPGESCPPPPNPGQ